MGGDLCFSQRTPELICFNPRPRMGGDATPQRWIGGDRQVSIHAPAWGATIDSMYLVGLTDVSIHAPAWGATLASFRQFGFGFGFNPRPRMGGDVALIFLPLDEIKFQSTPPHGGRLIPATPSDLPCQFQSTPPHGGRPR